MVIKLIHPNFKTVTVMVIRGNKFLRVTRLPVIIWTRTVIPKQYLSVAVCAMNSKINLSIIFYVCNAIWTKRYSKEPTQTEALFAQTIAKTIAEMFAPRECPSLP